LIWQDPVPMPDYKVIASPQIRQLKRAALDAGLSVADLVTTA
jgi:catalase-peroxidase